MEQRTILLNGVEVTCYEDGSVGWTHLTRHTEHRTFGCKCGRGYRYAKVGGKLYRVSRLIAEAFLNGLTSDLVVDHINGDKEDNRPSNLRIVTQSYNCRAFNAPSKGKSSKYRGVSWHTQHGKWCARATVGGRRKHVGLFLDERCAALAFDAFATEHGYAPEGLNFTPTNK